jgi:hypothetical protein
MVQRSLDGGMMRHFDLLQSWKQKMGATPFGQLAWRQIDLKSI